MAEVVYLISTSQLLRSDDEKRVLRIRNELSIPHVSGNALHDDQRKNVSDREEQHDCPRERCEGVENANYHHPEISKDLEDAYDPQSPD